VKLPDRSSGAEDSTRRTMKTLVTPSVSLAVSESPEGVPNKHGFVLCRVVVRHTEQIRQIRKIRQIRDLASLLAVALRSRKPNQGNGFCGSCGLRGSLLGRGGLHAPEHEDLGNILVQLRAPEISRGCSQKPLLGLCRVVVRHTEQIRQIRTIRQIRDHALLLAAARRNRKNTPGKRILRQF